MSTRDHGLSHQDLVRYVIQAIGQSARQVTPAPRVAAIGGYPYTGKTRLASEVAAAWEGPSFVLPTESAIKTRSDRLAQRQDGSSVESHDMSALVSLIVGIREGQQLSVPIYSWLTGDFIGSEQNPILDESGLLLVDGSVATTRTILGHVDTAFALRPERTDAWMNLAVDRDVAERSWEPSTALEQNQAKEETVATQLSVFGRRPHEHLLVVAIRNGESWITTCTSQPPVDE